MIVTAADLDRFVEETDKAGGPDAAASTSAWLEFTYSPNKRVDVSLDADGEPYFRQMMALYEELAGRKIDQAVTELTVLDVDRLVAAESPYTDVAPAARSVHYLRLAKAIHGAALPRGGRVLDMGCGWGLSSEFMAQLGFEVVAVDINPLFAQLVDRRAARLGLPIKAHCASFDDYVDEPGSFDAVLFYECFHHAVRPAQLLARLRAWLKPEGRLILAGEPIQSIHWPGWGLRLDPLSVYCIRKFGWFESGWSADYLRRIVGRSGLIPRVFRDDDPVIGTYLVAAQSRELDAATLATFADAADWWLEGEYLVSGRSGPRSKLELFSPLGTQALRLEVFNFRPQPLEVRARVGGRVQVFTLANGRNEVVLDAPSRSTVANCEFSFVPWCPDDLLHNGDTRRLGFHLKTLAFDIQAPSDRP